MTGLLSPKKVVVSILLCELFSFIPRSQGLLIKWHIWTCPCIRWFVRQCSPSGRHRTIQCDAPSWWTAFENAYLSSVGASQVLSSRGRIPLSTSRATHISMAIQREAAEVRFHGSSFSIPGFLLGTVVTSSIISRCHYIVAIPRLRPTTNDGDPREIEFGTKLDVQA